MDRSQAVGLVVLAAFLMAYFYFFAPKPTNKSADEPAGQTEVVEKEAAPQQPEEMAPVAAPETADDSLRRAQQDAQFGVFASGAEGREEIFTLENAKIKVEFSSKGGLIKKVTLKEYDDYKGDPLVLLDGDNSQINLKVSTSAGPVNLADLYFARNDDYIRMTDTAGVSFSLGLADGSTVVHTYYLPEDGYTVMQYNNYDALKKHATEEKLSFNWNNNMKKLDTDLEYNRQYTQLNYYTSFGDFEKVNGSSKDLEEVNFTQPVKWVSFKHKFFTTGLIANGQFLSGYMSSYVDPEDTLHLKNTKMLLHIPLEYYQSGAPTYTYYFGPNKLNTLKKVTEGFHKNLDMGWPVIRWINRYLIITTFSLLERFIPNYGIIIIILVFIIRIILSPLTYKSHIQMAKTKVLKPELDAIKEKHGDDMQKVQSEQMKLYSQVGVNPLSGCIPLLLQMPILFAMFQFIPHAIELRQEPFLWAKDLSMYDSIIDLPFYIWGLGSHISLFTLLMTLSTILITWSNSQMTASMQGPMKTMQYAMPVIFMFVLNSFPAGLTFYYFVSNLVSFGQLALMKRFVNEEKIRKILDENRKKNVNKKKSKFQMRLEEAMKASEEAKKKKKK